MIYTLPGKTVLTMVCKAAAEVSAHCRALQKLIAAIIKLYDLVIT